MSRRARPSAAAATAGPLLDSPGILWVVASHGFQGVRSRLTPRTPKANSMHVALPRMTAPQRFRFLMKLPSGPTMSLTSTLGPKVAGMPRRQEGP